MGSVSVGITGNPGGNEGMGGDGRLSAIPMSKDRSGNEMPMLGIAGNPGNAIVGNGTDTAMPISKARSGNGSVSDGMAGRPGKATNGSGGKLHAEGIVQSEIVHRVEPTPMLPAGPATIELTPLGGGSGPMVPRLPPPVFAAKCFP